MGIRERELSSLGAEYLTDFFAGAFIHDKEGDRVLRVAHCGGKNVFYCSAFSLKPGSREGWSGSIEFNFSHQDSFSLFAWPKLGYRNHSCPTLGNIVSLVQAERSTARGLRENSLSSNLMPIFREVGTVSSYTAGRGPALSGMARVRAVYSPVWYTFKEGMTRLREGDWIGFALNEDLAICLCYEYPHKGYEVHFRGKICGFISPEGNITMKRKVMERGAIRKLLQEGD